MSEFQKYLGVTDDFMKRLVMANKWCGQLTSNDTYSSDSWFSTVRTAEEAMAAGVDYCGPAKTSHKGNFIPPLKYIYRATPMFLRSRIHWVQR